MPVAVGIDTHKETHTAIALDGVGQVLGQLEIKATRGGYERLNRWASCLGQEVVFGIEGTGSWGANLTEVLLGKGCRIYEVERPKRRSRRRGKSDSIDALMAAKCVLSGSNLAIPRDRGKREILRARLLAYRFCVKTKTELLNQIQDLVVTGPISLRERLGTGDGETLVRKILNLRKRSGMDPVERALLDILKDQARRAEDLRLACDAYRAELKKLCQELNPGLLILQGVGEIGAAAFLVCDAERLRSEGAFALANGTAPIPASSGKTKRYRLNRGGDRTLNHAIHMIAIGKLHHDPESRVYVDRKLSEGKTKKEAIRALKRQISRRIYRQLVAT